MAEGGNAVLTYELKKAPGVPLYEALYRCIRGDILSGKLSAGEKLPSKRALSSHLEVSKITVETAYAQLLAEGFIVSREKVGYFVEEIHKEPAAVVPSPMFVEPEKSDDIDLTGSYSAKFPFSVWSKLQREVMLDLGEQLLLPIPHQGIWELRQAIAEHLYGFRGMQVSADCIFIGAGTDFLYNILVQLLGREQCYAVEEPGYGKIRKIYAAAGADCTGVPLDRDGVIPDNLLDAQVLHISPNHHFPTGLVTPLSRRKELLDWVSAGEKRWIIEDDYDSEFRFNAHPMPALQSLDRSGSVIYMNTFSRSLAPAIRISYMVLPPELMERLKTRLGFYSCTVPSFEQHTLARFIRLGYFEKHINRMRKYYKAQRNQVLECIRSSRFREYVTILEEDAGLHFVVKTTLADDVLVEKCRQLGLKVRTLASYYHGEVPQEHRSCLVINYAGISESEMERLRQLL